MSELNIGALGAMLTVGRTEKESSPPIKVVKPEVHSTASDVDGLGKGTVAKPNAQTLECAVLKLNTEVQSVQRDLQFSVDEGAEQLVVTVRDSATQKVIRQIPSEEALALSEKLAANAEAAKKGFFEWQA